MQVKWLALMAWRDSRRNRGRLVLFVSSIILGIAALVAIFSLSNNLRQEIDNQAAALLGADLEISDNKPFTGDIQNLVDSLGDRKSEERRFTSMVFFPKNSGTRLIEARALGGDFPYYGKLETVPAKAAADFRNGPMALVDQTLMIQFDIQPGDSVRIGNSSFKIAGTLNGAPGQTGLSASIAPVVYFPLQYLEQTGLEQKGSRINYRYYFKWDKNINMQRLMQEIEPRLEAADVNYDTAETQKEDTARSFRDVSRFLTLIGFIALLLGCIGVASSIHIYIREKLGTIAVLRCLGATAPQAFYIYLLQIAAIGFIGSVLGALLGAIIQQFLPLVLEDLLPITISTPISWTAIGQGILTGLAISLLFALLPLIAIRNISPLNTLRITGDQKALKDPVKWIIYLLIVSFVFGFTYMQTRTWQNALSFTVGLLLAFFILSAMASLLMWSVRKFFPSGFNYLWRQGLSNLYRPNNQTRVLIVSIGLGTALVCTIFFIQNILTNSVTLASSGNQPNMVLFDIQSRQKDSVVSLAQKYNLPVNGTVPIVNMRLEKINQVTAQTLEQDSTLPMRNWVFSREYRVTFRDTLISSEKITKGKWVGEASGNAALVPVSVEQNYAERNGINIGDTLTFNVQGALMTCIITSFREVDWNRIQTNFLIVFPKNSLEAAPQFHVLMTKVPDVQQSAVFQQALVKQFPNVSVIDLGLILSILDEILNKVGFVIRFMAGFSIITGLVVLIASIMISKFQRMQETVLLRTLGASRRQVLVITALEYFFLGALASLTGIVLALGSSWALAKYSFETGFTPNWLVVLLIFFFACLLTLTIGLLNNREVLNKPPLDILRQEV